MLPAERLRDAMQGRRILITGGTGFVGRHVSARLVEAGHALTLATRRDGPGDVPPGSRVVRVGEIGPATDWSSALDGVGAVIHLAAHVHVAPERAEAEAEVFDRVNHLATTHLYDQARTRGIRRFVFLSSITVLGGATSAGQPFGDRSVPRPETPYARSKLAAEEALRSRPGQEGLVILRPPLIAGPGVGGNLRSLAKLAALPFPLPFGRLRNRRTLLSLDNLASAITAALARPLAGTFVLGDRVPLSTGEIVSALRAGLGREPRLLPVPIGPMQAAARAVGFGGYAQRLFGDLEVDASGFRSAFAWQDVVTTLDTLRATGAALRRSGA